MRTESESSVSELLAAVTQSQVSMLNPPSPFHCLPQWWYISHPSSSFGALHGLCFLSQVLFIDFFLILLEQKITIYLPFLCIKSQIHPATLQPAPTTAGRGIY